MTVATRIRGNATPVMSFKTAAGSVLDFGADAVSIEWADGDGNQITFSDYAAGTPTQLNVTFVLDFAAANAYEYMYTNKSATGVTYVWQPSSAAASQTNPKFGGTLTIPSQVPRFTVEAGESTDFQTFDMSFVLDTCVKSIV